MYTKGHKIVYHNIKHLMLILIVSLAGCQSASKQISEQTLTESDALALAVELANQKCEARYSFAPFGLSSYLIEFKNGRWQWGSLDPAGESGFSAIVSFGPRGEDPHVEIFWSTDEISPERQGSDQPN
jgi:hypothetical protein